MNNFEPYLTLWQQLYLFYICYCFGVVRWYNYLDKCNISLISLMWKDFKQKGRRRSKRSRKRRRNLLSRKAGYRWVFLAMAWLEMKKKKKMKKKKTSTPPRSWKQMSVSSAGVRSRRALFSLWHAVCSQFLKATLNEWMNRAGWLPFRQFVRPLPFPFGKLRALVNSSLPPATAVSCYATGLSSVLRWQWVCDRPLRL